MAAIRKRPPGSLDADKLERRFRVLAVKDNAEGSSLQLIVLSKPQVTKDHFLHFYIHSQGDHEFPKSDADHPKRSSHGILRSGELSGFWNTRKAKRKLNAEFWVSAGFGHLSGTQGSGGSGCCNRMTD